MTEALRRLRDLLLELASEDYIALWEVARDFEKELGNVADNEVRTVRLALVSDLLRGSLIRVSRGPVSSRSLQPLGQPEALEALADPDNWIDHGPDASSVWFRATKKGENSHFGRRLEQ